METLVKYNSFLEAGNIEFEGFDNDDPEHRTSINNLLENWDKNCYLFDFNIIGNTDLKSPLFGFIKSCVYTDTKIKKYEKELKDYFLDVQYFYNQNRELTDELKKINEKNENRNILLEEHVFDIRDLYKKNRELTEEVKKIKNYVNGYMEETCSLKNENFNDNLICLEAELVNQQKINQYLLTRIYVIFAVLFFMFVIIIMISVKIS
jgi:hypothetical protein